MKNRFGIFAAVVIAAALTLTGCSSSDSATSESASCAKADLATVTEGKLTIATGEPAYYPWIIDDAPETGNGFEGAVAYAVAKQLGFDAADVVWVRTTFDSAVTPGEKNFDFNLQQFSITEERKNAVDFSSPYYTAPQAIVSFKGSKIDGKTTLAELKGAKLGAAVGTTSLDAISNQIGATPQVFNDNFKLFLTFLETAKVIKNDAPAPMAWVFIGNKLDIFIKISACFFHFPQTKVSTASLIESVVKFGVGF